MLDLYYLCKWCYYALVCNSTLQSRGESRHEFSRVGFRSDIVLDCFGFGHNRWVAVEGTVGQTIMFSVELFDGNTRLELEHGAIRVV